MNLATILCYMFCAPYVITNILELQSSKLLTSLNSSLNYYINNIGEINANIIIGVLITKGRLLKLSRINGVQEILDKSVLIMETLHPTKWALSTYAETFMEKLSENTTQEYLEPSSVINYPLTDLIGGHPTPGESDKCIFTMLTYGYAPNICKSAMSDPSAIGYTLSHQAIFFDIKYSLFPQQQINDKQRIKHLCSKMLAEHNLLKIESHNNVLMLDLFIEQNIIGILPVVVCAKYQNFTNLENLKLIFPLQTSNGCFQFYNKSNLSDISCDQHLSSVVMAAFSTYLHLFNI